MNSNPSPTPQEFVEAARQEFDYLRDDYGFVQGTAVQNPCSVVFSRDQVTIVVEGINWGFGVNVLLSHAKERVPLWAIARAKGRQDLPASGQLAQLRECAILLREVAEDVLKGDTSFLAIARQAMNQANAEASIPKVRRLP